MRNAIKILILIFLACGTAYAQPIKKKQRKTVLKQAKEHLEFEEFQKAIPYVQQLLDADPGSAYYNFWMGKCLYVTYKRNQALPFFESVERTNPEVDKEFHLYYGMTLHYNLELERAIEHYRLDLERYEPASKEYAWVNNRIAQCIQAKNVLRKKEGDQVKIENMGDEINTPFSEHSPVISANDSVLIFTARRPESLGAKPDQNYYDEDIYVSYRKNDKWSKAENIGTPVNSKGHDATISLTADGSRLYIYRHKKAGGLYVTDFDSLGKEWKEPRSVKKPVNSKYYEASICQSADSSLMFFTSDRPGGYGGRDIYVMRKDGKDWSEPMNAGGIINTPFDEDAPYFHPDGKTLYYSSNGPRSMGGFDIFVTEIDSNAPGGWLDPLNMGYPVNTPDDDIYFVLSDNGKNGYYSSGKEGGYGEKDIYAIEFPYYPYPRRYHVVELAGIVQDVNNLDTVSAMVRLIDKQSGLVVDSTETGPGKASYEFVLEPERSYALEVDADGYFPTTTEVTTPRLLDDDIFLEKNMLLEKPVIAAEEPEKQVFDIMNIYFDFDKDALRNESREELDRAVTFLEDNQDLEVQVIGHTDWFGTYDYNVDLSERRSSSAYQYLLESGITADRINQDFYSENKPLESNQDDTGRQFNRRVELRFFKDGQMVMNSKKLRQGIDGVFVDHTTPKGEAGFDNPTEVSLPVASASPDSGAEEEEAEENTRLTGDKPYTRLSGSDDNANRLSGDSNKEEEVTNTENSEAMSNLIKGIEGLELRHIYFDFDKYYLRGKARIELEKVIEILEINPDLEIEIYGHTDNFGSTTYNQQLSEKRSLAARELLLEMGVEPSRVSLSGFSELKPLDTNDTNRGRQNNRRVEFRVKYMGKTLYNSTP